MVGSCSSGSSGPSPKTSSSTSSLICCFSIELSSVGSASISESSAWRTSPRTRWLSMVASASRLILSSSLRCSVNFSSWYSGLSARLRAAEFRSSRCSQRHLLRRSEFQSRQHAICSSLMLTENGRCSHHPRLRFGRRGGARQPARPDLPRPAPARNRIPAARPSVTARCKREVVVRETRVQLAVEDLLHVRTADAVALVQAVDDHLKAVLAETQLLQQAHRLARQVQAGQFRGCDQERLVGTRQSVIRLIRWKTAGRSTTTQS